MITASHNTYQYNGLKFFNSDGYKISTILENKIEDIILNKKPLDPINANYHFKKNLH